MTFRYKQSLTDDFYNSAYNECVDRLTDSEKLSCFGYDEIMKACKATPRDKHGFIWKHITRRIKEEDGTTVRGLGPKWFKPYKEKVRVNKTKRNGDPVYTKTGKPMYETKIVKQPAIKDIWEDELKAANESGDFERMIELGRKATATGGGQKTTGFYAPCKDLEYIALHNTQVEEKGLLTRARKYKEWRNLLAAPSKRDGKPTLNYAKRYKLLPKRHLDELPGKEGE